MRHLRSFLFVAVALLAVVFLITADAQEQFTNNAASTLATAIDTDDTSVIVASGHGARFPTCCTGSQDFYIAVQSGATIEFMRVTNRSTDTLTVVRAQQSSSAASFGIGSRVEQRPTRGTFERFRDLTNANVTPEDDKILIGDSTPKYVKIAIPDCDNATTSKLLYDTTTNALSCGTDQGGSGASLTRISGSSGAAGADFTSQVLSANCTANATTTLATCMTTTGVGAGTWTFEYNVIYQAAATGTGVDFAIGHTGTVTNVVISSWFTSAGTTAASAIADQVSAATANLTEGKSARALSTKIGTTLGVDTANANMHMVIKGVVVVTVSGSLTLQHASEIAASTQVMANTNLQLMKM